ncbi:MAG: SprT family zinc-dependent metalloprotease [Thiobacillus sp.]|uniref:M48 family metallopeptidase n=1 Tax=Thiobacillus sp. TaxID=924 RepID=UPI002734D3BE|nr:SprT family zinc-dependent metalloprotease [Thiobacillus sp.]MDP3585968.1 SprT family zinc-dependent metalloprotease [Thiobacillus sp.]
MLQLGDVDVPYQLRRSHRRRTLGLTVTANEVRIHAPSWTPRAEIECYVLLQRDWLRRTWARMRVRKPDMRADKAGEVRYLGRMLALDIRDSLFVEVQRHGDTLRVHAPLDADIGSLVRAWLSAQAQRLLAWRLARLARKLGRAPSRFALSDAQTQWGSCTRHGHIRLNWRLVQAPLALIDYVAAHELAHLVHLDHSPRFWAQVGALYPDALARRTELRKMGQSLFQV